MNKAFLAIASMIVAHFMMKSWRKVHDRPETKEEVYRRMKAEHEALRKRYETFLTKVEPISTPHDGAKMMAAIGSVQQMRDALRPCRPVDGCDAMAMAPGRFS